MSSDRDDLSDEALTAYLDGEADSDLSARIEQRIGDDAELSQRLAKLDDGKDKLVDALSLDGLEAPLMPAHLLSEEPVATTARALAKPQSRLRLPMAMAASFVAGVLLMGTASHFVQPATSNWVEAVASYQALYVTETLASAPQADAQTEAVLAMVEAQLGVDLTFATQIEGLAFKRAQILGLDDEVLLQMAYLDADGVPFAFCITRTDEPDRGERTEMTHDLAATSWINDGVGYVLIGGQTVNQLEDLSAALIGQI